MHQFYDIPGYEGLYQINKLGEVKTLEKYVKGKGESYQTRPEHIMEGTSTVVGYRQVCLYKNGKPKIQLVHRLVGITFIPNPENKKEINHINGIKHDNRVENLEWCTRQENAMHAHKTGLQVSIKGSECKNAILNEEQVRTIRQLWNKRAYSQNELGKMFGLTRSGIQGIANGKSWKHVTI